MKNNFNSKNDNFNIKNSYNKSLIFLYNTYMGRFFLKILYNTWVSNFIGFILNRRISKIFINNYVRHNDIDLSLYEEKEYKSFNEFFTRKIKTIKKVCDKNCFISNCDCKISIYDISSDLILNIKNSKYNIEELVKDETIAREYAEGYAVVYRLEPSNYHRYIYIDNGKTIDYKNSGCYTLNVR